MRQIEPGQLGDDLSSPELALLVRRFEADWRSSTRARPDPDDYLSGTRQDRSAELAVLLRADLVLRREAGESRPIEWYRTTYPELDNEALLALIYEEYCLREEAGESPSTAEYEARFPEVARSFIEVIEIHDLVGPMGDSSCARLGKFGRHSPRPARPSRGSGWSRSLAAARSLAFFWPRNSIWPTGRSRSRYLKAARASPRLWRGFSTRTSFRFIRRAPIRSRGFIYSACPILAGSRFSKSCSIRRFGRPEPGATFSQSSTPWRGRPASRRTPQAAWCSAN